MNLCQNKLRSSDTAVSFSVVSFMFASIIASAFVLPSVSFAQGAALNPQEQCFSTLKADLEETSLFSEPLAQLASTTYADIAPQFSQKYKSLNSFGIQVDQGVITMRLYSFGRQTGYVHPPLLPLPSFYKSDTWTTPAKEYIISEEYVTDTSGAEHFLDCAFFQIQSDNLMGVTRDRYLYDGSMLSITKDAADGSYKSWYSENVSFDYQNKPFVTWKRLFVYPKSTQNSYFDKYDVADAYPSNKVASFDALSFFLKNPIKIEDYNSDTGTSTIKYLVGDSKGNATLATPPAALLPIVPSGIDTIFGLASYYQAIENKFPQFYGLLSINGTLKYDTFKQLISDQNINPDTAKLLSALMNYQSVASYSLTKDAQAKQGVKVSNPEMDGLLLALKNGDLAVKQFAAGATMETLKPESLTQPVIAQSPSYILAMAIGLLMLAVLGAAIVLWKNRKLFIKTN